MGQQQLQEVLEKLGSVGVIMPAVCLMVGIFLLMLGSKLAKSMCFFSGLILGGIGGLLLGEALVEQGGIILALVIGAAIAGALLSALLFRIWMAISGALIFGIAAACVAMLLQSSPTEPAESASPNAATDSRQLTESADEDDGISIEVPLDEITDQFRENLSTAIETDEDGHSIAELTLDNETARKVGSVILEALRSLASYYRGELTEWWAEAGAGARGGMMLIGLIAAVIGLLLGLIAPYHAASIQSTVAGAVLILFSLFSLLAQLMPDHLNWLPATPRGVLICLGLITAAGLAVQWTIFKRKTDK